MWRCGESPKFALYLRPIFGVSALHRRKTLLTFHRHSTRNDEALEGSRRTRLSFGSRRLQSAEAVLEAVLKLAKRLRPPF
eukprot:s217_g3.t1